MEQTALRPKPLPGHEPGPGRSPATSDTSRTSPTSRTSRAPGRDSRPHAARRRGRRLRTLLLGLLCATALVLVGVGLGTVGVTVISMSRLAEMQKQAGAQGAQGVPGAQGVQGAAAPGKGQGADPNTPPGQHPGKPGKPPKGPSGKADSRNPATSEGVAPARPPSPRPALGVEAVDAAGRGGAQLTAVHQPGPGYAAGLVRGDVLLAFGGTRVRSAGDLAKVVAAATPGRNVTVTVRHASGARQALTVKPGLVT
ncbi:PDZ domain-containing protein [Streptomyces aureocirculatus]|uniref:PDZ domain-containing protein n=1 Tax=Streptomyces aureocirculatus TaxID=67275 RepID=UPI0004C88F0E|nr:PDZ domain-containing protein [Streptomyces aureocirculatus]